MTWEAETRRVRKRATFKAEGPYCAKTARAAFRNLRPNTFLYCQIHTNMRRQHVTPRLRHGLKFSLQSFWRLKSQQLRWKDSASCLEPFLRSSRPSINTSYNKLSSPGSLSHRRHQSSLRSQKKCRRLKKHSILSLDKPQSSRGALQRTRSTLKSRNKYCHRYDQNCLSDDRSS